MRMHTHTHTHIHIHIHIHNQRTVLDASSQLKLSTVLFRRHLHYDAHVEIMQKFVYRDE